MDLVAGCVCSVGCFLRHKVVKCECARDAHVRIAGISVGEDVGLGWSLIQEGFHFIPWDSLKRAPEVPGVCVAVITVAQCKHYGPGAAHGRSQAKSILKLLDFLFFLCAAGKHFFLAMPQGSSVWKLPLLQKLCNLHGVYVDALLDHGIVHNYVKDACCLDLKVAREVKPSCWLRSLCKTVRACLREWKAQQLPDSRLAQTEWVFKCMTNSTRGLNKDIVSVKAAEQVMALLDSMQPGLESAHLQQLYIMLHLRGSDVRLDTGTVVDSCRQVLPYPAIAWEWRCVQSYAWATPNILMYLS